MENSEVLIAGLFSLLGILVGGLINRSYFKKQKNLESKVSSKLYIENSILQSKIDILKNKSLNYNELQFKKYIELREKLVDTQMYFEDIVTDNNSLKEMNNKIKTFRTIIKLNSILLDQELINSSNTAIDSFYEVFTRSFKYLDAEGLIRDNKIKELEVDDNGLPKNFDLFIKIKEAQENLLTEIDNIGKYIKLKINAK